MGQIFDQPDPLSFLLPNLGLAYVARLPEADEEERASEAMLQVFDFFIWLFLFFLKINPYETYF
jgi:hypothetical protein